MKYYDCPTECHRIVDFIDQMKGARYARIEKYVLPDIIRLSRNLRGPIKPASRQNEVWNGSDDCTAKKIDLTKYYSLLRTLKAQFWEEDRFKNNTAFRSS